MNQATTIPPRLSTLATALRPCLATLLRRLDEPALPDIPMGDSTVWLNVSLSQLKFYIEGMTFQVDQLMREVLSNEQAIDADIYRAAGRFEAYLDGFLDSRSGVRRAVVAADFVEARELLAGAFRHSLNEIAIWLKKLVNVLADPLAEARRRGMPENGPISLDLALNFTSAPETAQLNAWAMRKSQSNRRTGFWHLLGGFALGALLIDGISDHDCGSGES